MAFTGLLLSQLVQRPHARMWFARTAEYATKKAYATGPENFYGDLCETECVNGTFGNGSLCL